MDQLTSEKIEKVIQDLSGVVRDEPMSKHTNFRIGGPARLYFVANDAKALVNAVRVAREAGAPWYVFGGGSNMLVSDDGYEGLMIQSALRDLVVEDAMIKCGSGAVTALAARKSAEAGLTGFEWAVGVPGTIGGAIYGNAGCFGGEMKDVVESVDAYRVSDGRRVSYSNTECGFGYRESRFKNESHLILGCVLRLTPGDKDAVRRRLDEIIAARKAKQPLEQSSAGCVFKNFEFEDESALDILRRSAEVPPDMLKSKRISAGWLVDRVGLLGKRLGDVQVSDRHGNFVLNTGGGLPVPARPSLSQPVRLAGGRQTAGGRQAGRAQDVVALMSLVKMKVRDELGILLEDEVQLVGF